MRLFVVNHKNERVYLNTTANSRNELAQKFNSNRIIVHGRPYHVNSVFAEDESDNTVGGAIVGGVIGILGGPIGIMLGAVAGGYFGNNMATEESSQVQLFNNSSVL